MSARTTGMDQHPDIAELRARYERVSETAPAHAVDGITFLAGLYLAVSPWIVGFMRFSTLTVNNLITGIAVALMAVGLASAYARMHGMAGVVPLIGVWTIIAPWVMSGHVATKATIWSNVVVGAVLVAFGLGAMGIGLMSKKR